MTDKIGIDEAIKEMSSWKLDCRLAFNERHEKAIRLGIEGLQRLQELRVKAPTPIYLIEKPLPSEKGAESEEP